MSGRRTMIHLDGIHKGFGDREILRGIHLEVLEGETICIIGGSGTGKSVTLKHIMRLLDPDQGRIWLDGEDITTISGDRLNAARLKLGVNFQFGALLNWLTVFENVALPLRETTDMKEDEIERRVMAKLELLSIPHARDLFPTQISGGMKKRCGLARAVVMEESLKVILYDEPTSGLDPISTAVVDEMVNEMKDRLGLTQVIVTHDMASAYRTADRIAVIHEGIVVQYDTPEGIQNSTHPYTIKFVHGLTSDPDKIEKDLKSGMLKKDPASGRLEKGRISEIEIPVAHVPTPTSAPVPPEASGPLPALKGAVEPPPSPSEEEIRALESGDIQEFVDSAVEESESPSGEGWVEPPEPESQHDVQEPPRVQEDDQDVFLISSESNRLMLGDTESTRVPIMGESLSGRVILDAGSSDQQAALDPGVSDRLPPPDLPPPAPPAPPLAPPTDEAAE